MDRNHPLYGHESKSTYILDLIARSGPEGMRFTDIQRTLWSVSHPDTPFTRDLRGYWCTNLLGGSTYHLGLLGAFCTKLPSGRYVRNDTPHEDAPWSVLYELSRKRAEVRDAAIRARNREYITMVRARDIVPVIG